MKHIKIFEEYVDNSSGYQASPLSDNEINYLKMKGIFFKTGDDYEKNYINYYRIKKINDGWYLLNYDIRCSSLAEVIKYTTNVISELKVLFMELFGSLKKTKPTSGTAIRYQNEHGNTILNHDLEFDYYDIYDVDIIDTLVSKYHLYDLEGRNYMVDYICHEIFKDK